LARLRPQLRVLAAVASRPGFAVKLAETLAELRAYQVTPQALRGRWEELAAGGSSRAVLADKLHDLSLVLAAFDERLTGRFTDPDDVLAEAARRLPAAPSLRGARVWVDGFVSFTPQELRFLGALLRTAGSLTVTLCLDPDRLSPGSAAVAAEAFLPVAETRRRLLELAAAAGAAVEEKVLSGQPRFRHPALACVEAGLAGRRVEPWRGQGDAVSLVSAPDRRAEVTWVAAEVLRLCREEGYRFRDVAVIVRDLEGYGDLIAAAFGEHGIPYFLDRRRPVAHHPLVELVRAAVAVIAEDWPYEAVFRFLKTDLVPLARDDVDRLENAVLARGIRGSARWRDDGAWPADLRALRSAAAAPLWRFRERLGDGPRRPVRLYAEALLALLVELDVAGRVEAWRSEDVAAGRLEAAREHEAVLAGLVDLLDQAVLAMGDEAMTAAEFLALLEAGLEGLEAGLVPPGLDQVVVGSVERSRHPAIRAVFVLGVTDRAFPPAPAEDAILSDAERETLWEHGLELAPTSRVRLFHEAHYTYVAMTRARDRLSVSWPRADERGRACHPSLVVARLQALVPGARRLDVPAAGEAPPADDPAAAATAVLAAATGVRALAAAFAREWRRTGGRPAPAWCAAWRWLTGDTRRRAEAEPVLASLRPRRPEEVVAPDIAAALSGREAELSVTRLETFAACPFRHFAAHVLGLRERAVFRVAPPDLGRFYHEALRRVGEAVAAAGRDWADLDQAEVDRLLDAVTEELAPLAGGHVLLSTAAHRHLLSRLRQTLGRAVSLLVEHARRGAFRPVGVEVGFGGGERLQALSVPLPEGGSVRLRGRIDRLEAWRAEDGTVYLRVLDFKSRQRDFRLDEVFYGLSLQLPVYLLAALRGLGFPAEGTPAAGAVQPAGLLYIPIEQRVVTVDGPATPEAVAAARRRATRATGLVLADPAVIRQMDRRSEDGAALIPAGLTRDGAVTGRSAAAPSAALHALLAWCEAQAGVLASGVLAGRAD
ncbi:MAG: exodeoxyribonuclease V subunit gamma, partial [Clostridia bacterium]|nr:exodeoxyribonuclease V subunit gamma [Clostridia bacterium]